MLRHTVEAPRLPFRILSQSSTPWGLLRFYLRFLVEGVVMVPPPRVPHAKHAEYYASPLPSTSRKMWEAKIWRKEEGKVVGVGCAETRDTPVTSRTSIPHRLRAPPSTTAAIQDAAEEMETWCGRQEREEARARKDSGEVATYPPPPPPTTAAWERQGKRRGVATGAAMTFPRAHWKTKTHCCTRDVWEEGCPSRCPFLSCRLSGVDVA